MAATPSRSTSPGDGSSPRWRPCWSTSKPPSPTATRGRTGASCSPPTPPRWPPPTPGSPTSGLWLPSWIRPVCSATLIWIGWCLRARPCLADLRSALKLPLTSGGPCDSTGAVLGKVQGSRGSHPGPMITTQQTRAPLTPPDGARHAEFPRLVAEDVVVLRGGRRVLDGISLTLAPGELVAVI